MKRTLRLQRETLGSLSDDDLSGVVGGNLTRVGGGPSCDGLVGCVVTLLSCDCIGVSLQHCLTPSLPPTCTCNSFPGC